MDRAEQDAALVRAAREGDRAAFAALLVRHQPPLLAICRRALGDDGLAEVATQEAVLQAFAASSIASANRERLPPLATGPGARGLVLGSDARWPAPPRTGGRNTGTG